MRVCIPCPPLVLYVRNPRRWQSQPLHPRRSSLLAAHFWAMHCTLALSTFCQLAAWWQNLAVSLNLLSSANPGLIRNKQPSLTPRYCRDRVERSNGRHIPHFWHSWHPWTILIRAIRLNEGYYEDIAKELNIAGQRLTRPFESAFTISRSRIYR